MYSQIGWCGRRRTRGSGIWQFPLYLNFAELERGPKRKATTPMSPRSVHLTIYFLGNRFHLL